MRNIETKTEMVERTTTRILEASCDLCGQPDRSLVERADEGRRPLGKFAEVTVECIRGRNFGQDGMDAKTTVFDVCPVCWDRVVVPFLVEQGAKPREENCSW